MRSLLLLLPIAALAACEPEPVGFDKYAVGSMTERIDARDAAADAAAVARRSAPSYSFTSRQMRRSDTPLSQNDAALASMSERKTRKGIPLSAGGQSFAVSQVTYDGQHFLVAHPDSAGSGVDQSEALKSMSGFVTACSPSGPAWREGGSYAVALSCL